MSAEDRAALLAVARQAISAELDGRELKIPLDSGSEVLQAAGASFVTLRVAGQLRGCIGTLEPRQPLIIDVAANARRAAFRDPRFPPLQREEWQRLDVHISVLRPAESMHFNSEADLLRQLRPGIDGVVLEEGGRRGTFLPDVWEALPEPAEFLRQLKLKAGLEAHYWSPTITAARYTTESIP
jgi:uncharacterized protein